MAVAVNIVDQLREQVSDFTNQMVEFNDRLYGRDRTLPHDDARLNEDWKRPTAAKLWKAYCELAEDDAIEHGHMCSADTAEMRGRCYWTRSVSDDYRCPHRATNPYPFGKPWDGPTTPVQTTRRVEWDTKIVNDLDGYAKKIVVTPEIGP